MLTLNIIPEELKKDNKLMTIYLSTKKLMIIFLLFFIIYAAALFGAKIILRSHYEETDNEANLLTKNTENYSKQVGAINAQINAVETIQNNTVFWSYLIEFFSNKLPNGIILKTLQVDKETKIINLSGVAETRDALLLLKSLLEADKTFSDINLPIKSLLEKENISFSIQTKYTTYEFDK
jgi:Tfp pilus assembly protein PilN